MNQDEFERSVHLSRAEEGGSDIATLINTFRDNLSDKIAEDTKDVITILFAKGIITNIFVGGILESTDDDDGS
jgi:hypothetical protein